MAAAKPTRTRTTPSPKTGAKAAAKATPKGASKPSSKATGRGPDEQVKALQKASRQIQTQGEREKAQRHQEMMAKQFNRGIRVAELRHAKQMGLEHGRAKVEGLSVGQRQQQHAAGSTQSGANRPR